MILPCMIVRHTDNLSKTLQSTTMSAAEGQQVAGMTVSTLQHLRSDDVFDAFWSKVCGKAKQWRVNEPELPRRRKIPKRFGGAFPDTPKSYYRQAYYEGIDLITNCIQERFTQEGYATYSPIEALLVKAYQQDFETELAAVCAFYSDDFDKSLLHVQLDMSRSLFCSNSTEQVIKR